MTNKEKWYDKQATRAFKKKYKVRTKVAKKELGKKKQRKIKKELARRRRIFASWKNPELNKLRKTPEYKAWREEVLERDDYTCQNCEKTGVPLQCHHLKTFKMHEEIRYDIDNGIVLCKKCHANLHIANVDHKPFVIKLRA